MAIFSQSKVATNNSDANFRAWGKAISDGLASVGLTQTADTGQINWATVTAPASSTVGGYEIWRLNDALQATSPYFFKIEYGTGSTTSNPQVWITVGHITDGAGTLTLGSGQGSVVRHLLYLAAGASASVSPTDINVSGSSSRFGVCLWRGASTQSAFIGFERSKDNAGANTGEYGTLLMAASGNSSLIKQYTLPINGGGLASPGTESRWLMATTTLSSSSFNNKKGLSEIKPFIGKYGNPMTIACGLETIDWATDGETFTASLYGVSQTYMAIKSVYTSGLITNSDAMAMRWD